jgi:DNA-binding response OmpR family regulator
MRLSRIGSAPFAHDDDTEIRRTARVAVLVDAAALRRRICCELASAGHLVLADGSDADVATLLQDLRPEVIVVDVAAWSSTPFVVDVMGEQPVWIALVPGDPMLSAASLANGFDDVVTPPHDPREIVARVDAVLSRRRRRGWLQFGDVSVDLDAHEVLRAEQPVSLTVTEFRLLVTLLRHRHQVLSKPQLLELVWGFDDYDTNVVEVHMSALRRKVEAVGPRFIHTVRGVGYVARQGAPATSTPTP